jgi:predicted nucleotidyltransferase
LYVAATPDGGVLWTQQLTRACKRRSRSRLIPLLFATLSGAHLYGFASPDSDFDVRGVHILPLREVLRLDPACETVENTTLRAGLEIDLVTHEVRKFFHLMLKKNGC